LEVNGEDLKPTGLNGFNLKSKFRRKFLIPNIDLESFKATVKDGILVIQLKSGKRKEYTRVEI